MYQPASFTIEDSMQLWQFVKDYPFATIIASTTNSPEISHIPLLTDSGNNLFFGHIARANPLRQAIENEETVTAICHGPHGYVSPSWYATLENNVPTWNYAVVHITGKIQPVSEEKLIEILKKLQISNNDKPVDWENPLIMAKLKAIIGFQLKPLTITGKFKLSQNRSTEDQVGVINNLLQLNPELAKFMRTNLS